MECVCSFNYFYINIVETPEGEWSTTPWSSVSVFQIIILMHLSIPS